MIDANINLEDYFSQGALVVSRLTNLALIDQALGYEETNALLKRIGNTLELMCLNQPSLIAGRLNGTDFAIFSKEPVDAYLLGKQVKSALEKTNSLVESALNSHFVTVTTPVGKHDSSTDLMTIIDGVLDQLSANEENILHIINQDDLANYVDTDRNEWERLLNSALDHNRLKLEHYPVVNQNGELIHNESPVRLQLVEHEKWFCAGEFITWAMQLNLISRIDERVLENAIQLLLKGAEPIGLNISATAFCDTNFVKKTVALIQANRNIAHRLYLEVPEQGAFDHFAEFKYFCHALKSLGCKIGIEHVGTRISQLGELHDVGLDYIKIDASIIRQIDLNDANKTLLKGLCLIAHSIGILAIAEGVQTIDEIEALKLIGLDGMTGPGIKNE